MSGLPYLTHTRGISTFFVDNLKTPNYSPYSSCSKMNQVALEIFEGNAGVLFCSVLLCWSYVLSLDDLRRVRCFMYKIGNILSAI